MTDSEIRNLTAKDLLEPDLYADIYDDPNELQRESDLQRIRLHAKELGVVKAFDAMSKSAKELQAKLSKERKAEPAIGYVDAMTNFGPDRNNKTYDNLDCRGWIANDEEGVKSLEGAKGYQVACYCPILPVRRMENIETKREQITIAFKRNDTWKEITVPKKTVATAKAITDLSDYGVPVTSENAKYLVKYLADLENWNEGYVELIKSTTKFGWRQNTFVPYDKEIVFDGEEKFRQLYDSIHSEGDYDVWLDHMREIRAGEFIEPKLALAASFASPLIELLEINPSVIDLWGQTEGGKTVCLMVAASVWADPAEGQYIGDYKTTDTALEVRADVLNNLPLILDDTSKADRRIRDNYETMIYELCSGKGKSRSNKDLGTNRERYWKLDIITNGERPMSSYAFQGGAINRILEVDCGPQLFEDPHKTADIVRNNFGYAGREYIEQLKKVPKKTLVKAFNMYVNQLTSDSSMNKQVQGAAALMLAYCLSTEIIFHDDSRLTADDMQPLLVDRHFLSDAMRCYQYINDVVVANEERHFDSFNDSATDTFWGWITRDEKGNRVVYFLPTYFNKVLEEEGFSRNTFTSWAKEHDCLIWEKPKKPGDKHGDTKRYKGKRVVAVILCCPSD